MFRRGFTPSPRLQINQFRLVIAIAVIAVDCGFPVQAQVVWTGANNGSGPYTGQLPGGGTFNYYYPNSDLWTESQQVDQHGNVLAPGNWSTPTYPNSPAAVVAIGPATSGNSYPPRIGNNADVHVGTLTLNESAQLIIRGGGFDSSFLTVYHQIDNQGTIDIQDPGPFVFARSVLQMGPGDTQLTGGGAVTLTGGGDVNKPLNDYPLAAFRGTATDSRLINVDNTIQGAGYLGYGSMGLLNQAMIDANLGGGFAIEPNGLGVTNTGTMRASNGSTLHLLNGTFENAGGLIQAQTGSTVNVRNAAVSDGVVEILAGGTLSSQVNATLSGEIRNASGGTVSLTGTPRFGAGAVVDNQGTFQSNATIQVEGPTTLSGSGAYLMSLAGNSPTAALVIDSQLRMRGTMTLSGFGAGVTNQGTLTPYEGTLSLVNGAFDNSSGVIQVPAGSMVQITNATIAGGALHVTDGGTLSLLQSEISGELQIAGGGTVTLSDSSCMDGTVVENAGIFQSASGALRADGLVTIGGGGTFAAPLLGNGPLAKVLISSDIFASGAWSDFTDGITNQATVSANGLLELFADLGGLSNLGTIRAITGGTLNLSSGIHNNSGGTIAAQSTGLVQVISGVTVSNAGGIISAESNGTVEFQPGAVVDNTNGLIVASADGNINVHPGVGLTPGSVEVRPGGRITFGLTSGPNIYAELVGNHSLMNQGDVQVNGLRIAAGDLEFTGNGDVAVKSLLGTDPTSRLVNMDNTIRGVVGTSSSIGAWDSAGTSLEIVNNGVIEATGSLALKPKSGAVTNTGVLRAAGGGQLALVGAVIQNSEGVIETAAGSRITIGDLVADGTRFVTEIVGGTLRAAAATQIITTSAFAEISELDSLELGLGATMAFGGEYVELNAGTHTNQGNLNLFSDAQLRLAGDVLLAGAGTILMTPSALEVSIQGSEPESMLWNLGNTIRGAGRLGNGTLGIVNQGVIEAWKSVPSNPAPGLVVAPNEFGIINNGIFRAVATARLTLSGSLLDNTGGEIVAGTDSIVEFQGTFANTGQLTAMPAGTITSNSVISQVAGATRVDGALIAPALLLNGGLLTGIGVIDADVTLAGGTLAPGSSPGTLHIMGSYEQGAGGVMELQLGGYTAGTDFDQLVVSDDLQLGGALMLSLWNEFLPQLGDSFTVITSGNASGGFATVDGVSIDPDLSLAVVSFGNDWHVVAALPGDANLDQLVDGGDYTIWADSYLATGRSWATGDFTGDGLVDGGDYTVWADHYSPASTFASAVPEPSTLVLAGVGTLALLTYRRRAALSRIRTIIGRLLGCRGRPLVESGSPCPEIPAEKSTCALVENLSARSTNGYITLA